MVCSLDGDADLFDIVAGVLQGDRLAPFLFIIYLNNRLKMLIELIKENSFILKEARSRYLAEIITDADYTDDLALLANALA